MISPQFQVVAPEPDSVDKFAQAEGVLGYIHTVQGYWEEAVQDDFNYITRYSHEATKHDRLLNPDELLDVITLRQRLAEAESALHRLMIGELEVTVSVGGYGATTYAHTDIDKLSAYIATLKTQIATKEKRPRRGPLFMTF